MSNRKSIIDPRWPPNEAKTKMILEYERKLYKLREYEDRSYSLARNISLFLNQSGNEFHEMILENATRKSFLSLLSHKTEVLKLLMVELTELSKYKEHKRIYRNYKIYLSRKQKEIPCILCNSGQIIGSKRWKKHMEKQKHVKLQRKLLDIEHLPELPLDVVDYIFTFVGPYF